MSLKQDGLAMGLSVLSASAGCGLLAGAVESFNSGDTVAFGLQAGGGAMALAWAASLWADRRPKRPAMGQIVASATEPVRVNGRNLFLHAVPWLGKAKTLPAARQAHAFYVPYKGQGRPIRVFPGQVVSYAHEGWGRQQRGEDYPFSRRKFYESGWSVQLESCCYQILGRSGCFDKFGQGAHSRLWVTPNRVREVCLRRYSPALS